MLRYLFNKDVIRRTSRISHSVLFFYSPFPLLPGLMKQDILDKGFTKWLLDAIFPVHKIKLSTKTRIRELESLTTSAYT